MKRTYGMNVKVLVNKGDQGVPNERKYIIDAKWWRKWCDYTGFESINQTGGYSFRTNEEVDETVVFSCEKPSNVPKTEAEKIN